MTTSDQYNAQGQLIDGIDPTQGHFTISYNTPAAGDETYNFDNGNVEEFNSAGQPIYEDIGGTKYDEFNAQGDPVDGIDPTQGHFTISYNTPAAGDETYNFDNGNVEEFNSAGQPIYEDIGGTKYDEFNAQGDPVDGIDPTQGHFTISYNTPAAGDETYNFDNGNVEEFNSAGQPIYEDIGGTKYDEFNAQGDPVDGIDPTQGHFTISYNTPAAGDETYNFDNGNVEEFNSAGQPIYEDIGGTKYDEFNAQGDPVDGIDPTQGHFTISYNTPAAGDETYNFDNGNVEEFNSAGQPIYEDIGGTKYDEFNAQGDPVDGIDPTQGHFTISYNTPAAGDETYNFDNGNVEEFNSAGQPIYEDIGGTKYDEFNAQGDPVDGIDPTQGHFTISYNTPAAGDETYNFDNGNVEEFNSAGQPIYEDIGGTKYDEFNAQGDPVDGIDPTQGHFTISYNTPAAGDETYNFDNGNVEEFNSAGQPIYEDIGGTKYDEFNAQGDPVDGIDPTLGHFTISYNTAGDATWKFDNGITEVFNPAGNMIGIVFNGTTLTGTYDPSTGIFTASNGSFYFIGTNGILSATLDPADGSYKLSDGSIVMTPQAWKVDLPAFLDAINFVQTYSFLIMVATTEIQAQYSAIESAWSSPAGSSFSGVASDVNVSLDYLNAMLTDIVGRMKTSYQNYLSTENAITQGMSARSA